MTFNPFCNVGILNIDFNWFLTCLDFKGFKHFILMFYYFKLWEKEKFIIVYTAEQKFQADTMPFSATCVRNGNIESAKQVSIIYFIFKIEIGMFSILMWGSNLQNVGGGGYPLSAQRRLWSDWADAESSLCAQWIPLPPTGLGSLYAIIQNRNFLIL